MVANSRVRRAGQARRGLRAGQRPAQRGRGPLDHPRFAAPSTRGHGSPAGRDARRIDAAIGLAGDLADSTTGTRPTSPSPRSRRARSARHLLHEREHRAAEGRRALAPRQLAAHVPGRDDRAGRRRAPCACSRCSTWRAGRSRSARGRAARAGPLRARPRRRRRCCDDGQRHRAARLYCIPAVWARILEHGVEALRPVGAARSRHRHVGDAARAARRDQGRAPAHRDARLLRLDRSRARRTTRRRRPRCASRAASASRNPASRCGSTRRRRGVHAQPVPDGRLLRRSRGDRRGAASTAGTTPAISARSTTTATCRSSAGARDVIRTGGETVAPAEVEAVLGTHPGDRRGRGGRRARPQWGEVVTAVVVVRAGRRGARRRGAAGLLRRAASPPFKHPRRVRGRRRAAPHRRDRPDPAHPDRRAHLTVRIWNTILGVQNVVPTLGRTASALADRHEAYADRDPRPCSTPRSWSCAATETIDPRVSDIVPEAGLSQPGLLPPLPRARTSCSSRCSTTAGSACSRTIEQRMARADGDRGHRCARGSRSCSPRRAIRRPRRRPARSR